MTVNVEHRAMFYLLLAAEERSPDIPESDDVYGWLCGSWDLDVRRYGGINVAERGLKGAVSLAGWWAGDPATTDTLLALRNRPGLLAVAGIARPQRFFDMLAAQGLHVDTLALPDHADFSTLPWTPEVAGVVLTEKDAVKLRPERVGTTPTWVVTLDFSLGAGFEAALDTQLKGLLPSPWIND